MMQLSFMNGTHSQAHGYPQTSKHKQRKAAIAFSNNAQRRSILPSQQVSKQRSVTYLNDGSSLQCCWFAPACIAENATSCYSAVIENGWGGLCCSPSIPYQPPGSSAADHWSLVNHSAGLTSHRTTSEYLPTQ